MITKDTFKDECLCFWGSMFQSLAFSQWKGDVLICYAIICNIMKMDLIFKNLDISFLDFPLQPITFITYPTKRLFIEISTVI